MTESYCLCQIFNFKTILPKSLAFPCVISCLMFSKKKDCVINIAKKIKLFCCHGIENIAPRKISKSVWAVSISQKNYWLVTRIIIFHFSFLQLKLFLLKLSLCLFSLPKHPPPSSPSTSSGNFTCLEVVFKFKRRLGWDISWLPKCQYVDLSIWQYVDFLNDDILISWMTIYLDFLNDNMLICLNPGTTYFTLMCPPAWLSSCPGSLFGSSPR